jgi:lipopolysaccharide heptosyltransferase I
LELQRFLIVRLGALGDVVHAIPVAAALRRAYPDARIDWLVSAKHREILDLVPVIDRRIVINDRPSTPSHGQSRSGQEADATAGTSLLGAVRELRRARYDVAIDLQGLVKSALLARLSGAPRVVGFSSRYARERAARIFYTDAHDPGRGGLYDPRETRHVVDINIGVLSVLGITTARREFPIEEVDSGAARALRAQTGGRYALLNPGAAWPNKRWPPARLAAIAVQLRERCGLMSVVLWGPGEDALAAEVVDAASGAAVLSPRTTIVDLVALARHAALMVSGDTGPTHIAAALGTPIVGIYGPTRPARNGPMSPLDITVSRDTICQCHHLRRCRLDRMCLLDIEVAEVAAAVERRLAAETGHA